MNRSRGVSSFGNGRSIAATRLSLPFAGWRGVQHRGGPRTRFPGRQDVRGIPDVGKRLERWVRLFRERWLREHVLYPYHVRAADREHTRHRAITPLACSVKTLQLGSANAKLQSAFSIRIRTMTTANKAVHPSGRTSPFLNPN
jgi:hypothetical protein